MREAATTTTRPRVLLVQTPWVTPARPSIAIGILQRLCAEAGVDNDAFFFNFDLACEIGLRNAEMFADGRVLFGVSEHLFAADLFGIEALGGDNFLEAAATTLQPQAGVDIDLFALRDRVIPRFLDDSVARILAWRPTVVGLSATFNQVMACLALAGRIRDADPSIQLIFGGACFAREMGVEYHRALPNLIDHVFLGEAETPFRTYLSLLTEERPTTGIAGTTWADGETVSSDAGEALRDMRQSPPPDYESYFRERRRIETDAGIALPLDRLMFEASRGCWWGQKNHCVFCGLNRDTIHFREKPVDQVLSELVEMSRAHGCTAFLATDWIVSRDARAEMFERLKDLGLDLNVFFETRSDLNKAEVRLMKQAGVHKIQPGIESFSTPLLKLMRKHSTGVRQLQFLRWCAEFKVAPAYNLLCGFPGESASWYEELTSLIPKIVHLRPPRRNLIEVEIHRFSPLFEERDAFGLDGLAPRTDYRHNFPPGLIDLGKICYFFEVADMPSPQVRESWERLAAAVDAWMAAHQSNRPPEYTYELGPGFVRLRDRRPRLGGDGVLRGLAARIVLLADAVTSRNMLVRDLAPLGGAGAIQGDVSDYVDGLIDAGVLHAEGEALLTLPIGRTPRVTEDLRALALSDLFDERGAASAPIPEEAHR